MGAQMQNISLLDLAFQSYNIYIKFIEKTALLLLQRHELWQLLACAFSANFLIPTSFLYFKSSLKDTGR